MPDKKSSVRRTQKQPEPQPDHPTVALDPTSGLFIGRFKHLEKVIGSPADGYTLESAKSQFHAYCVGKGHLQP